MSDGTALKVGDVCKDPAQLRVGMTVGFSDCPSQYAALLSSRCEFAHGWNRSDGGIITDRWLRINGVTILALPEEAPVDETQPREPGCQCHWEAGDSPCRVHGLNDTDTQPAAPSLDAVTVNSRWRWNGGVTQVTAFVWLGADEPIRYLDGDTGGLYDRAEILAHATRIDEPAGAGKATRLCNAQWGARYTCDLLAGHDGEHRDILLEKRAEKKAKAAPAPAMPPARCAPGCTPSKSCRITIPVTDKGTRYECPAFAEDLDYRMTLKNDEKKRDYLKRGLIESTDVAEARSMRGQQWEPRSLMVGRFRYDRRPR